jgi:hypothetical protein
MDLGRSHSAYVFAAGCLGTFGCSGPTRLDERPQGPPVREAVTGGQGYVDDVDEDPASLNGCDPVDRSVIRQAGIYMRTLSGFTEYFRDCVRDSVLESAPFVFGGVIGPYVPCPADPLADHAREDQLQQAFMARLFPNLQIVGCGYADGGGGVTKPADIGPWGKTGPERFELAQTQIDQANSELQLSQGTQTLALLAGLMLHEAYHNQGYLHEPPGTCPGQRKGTNDMPSIVQMCIQKASVDRTLSSRASCSGECRSGGHLVIPKLFENNDGTCVCEMELGAMRPDSREDDPPQLTDFSNAATDATGTALASGNFDNDFYDDLAVSVPGEQKVEIYYGSVWGLVRLADLTEDALDESEAEDEFGAALAVADFDGDGFDDIAVGAPGENQGEGRVYAYRGSLRGMRPSQTLSALGGAHAHDRFGAALAAGFDGDALAREPLVDRFLAVGAPGRATTDTATGTVQVFSTGGESDAGPRLSPFSEIVPPRTDASAGMQFGAALSAGIRAPLDAPTGDMDARTAPGVAIIVGAPGWSQNRGKAYLYDGSRLDHDATPEPAATLQLGDLTPGARFGSAVAFGRFGTLGPKVFVGAPGADRVDRFEQDQETWSPGAHEDTLFGPPGRDFGSSLAGLRSSGNLAGLLFVGAPSDDGQAPLGGFVAVYGTDGTATVEKDRLTQALMSVSEPGDRFGAALALGDFDRDTDGSVAVAVGAPGDYPSLLFNAPGSGAVFTYKQSNDPCRRFLGWRTHTDSGRIWHSIDPSIPSNHRPADGDYASGDRVLSECDVYQATVDSPGSDLSDSSQWQSLDLRGGGIAPTPRPQLGTGDSEISCSSSARGEVALDGTDSYDLDNAIVDYEWSTHAGPLATGARAKAMLPVGKSVVVLTVTDETRIKSSASLEVTVRCNDAGGAETGRGAGKARSPRRSKAGSRRHP